MIFSLFNLFKKTLDKVHSCSHEKELGCDGHGGDTYYYKICRKCGEKYDINILPAAMLDPSFGSWGMESGLTSPWYKVSLSDFNRVQSCPKEDLSSLLDEILGIGDRS